MSGKIEISRELIERCFKLAALATDFETSEELRALLAAPVVERQPVAWMALNRDGFPEKCLPTDPEVFPVYREQPAPVAVCCLSAKKGAQ